MTTREVREVIIELSTEDKTKLHEAYSLLMDIYQEMTRRDIEDIEINYCGSIVNVTKDDLDMLTDLFYDAMP